MYVQKVTKVESPIYWVIIDESKILAQMGRYKEAIKVAEQSMALAAEDGNETYVKMNRENIAKWSKM